MAKNKPVDPKLEVQELDTSTGTAADVEAVMRKFDRESNTRIWNGTPKLVVSCILAAFSLFCIYVTLFANFLEQVRMTSFMGLVIIMGFLTFPASKNHVKPNHLPWYDIVIMLAGAAAFFYYSLNAHAILNTRLKEILTNPTYTIIAVVGIVVLAELCRRSVGLPILCVAIFFIIYTFLNGKTLSRTAYEMLRRQRHPGHAGECVLQVHRRVHHLRRVPGEDRRFQLLHQPGEQPHRPLRGRPRQGGGHLLRAVRHGVGFLRGQHRHHRFRHHSHDEEDRLPRGIRGRG